MIYLAGPMSGKPAYNLASFMEARRRLELVRYEVETPFDASNRVWKHLYGRDFNPFVDKVEYGSQDMSMVWLADMEILCRATAIAVLPGWMNSRGTRLEVQTAVLLGKKVLDAQTGKELFFRVQLSFTEAG